MNTPETSPQDTLFVGWDVGAWNCDDNRKSRDALCVLSSAQGLLRRIGLPWRGNVRQALDENIGCDVPLSLISECVQPVPPSVTAIIAIDTPLGWPKAMIELVVRGDTDAVPREAAQNPYLFRETERRLFQNESRPLSAVRDMIGSQSTKGIHFLAKSGFVRLSTGVWKLTPDAACFTAIETYPSPCRRNPSVVAEYEMLRQQDDFYAHHQEGTEAGKDIEDALICAIVASRFFRQRACFTPPTTSPEEEGWIWIPT
jgi:hypothetical protein